LQIKFDDSHKPVGRDNFDPVGIEQGEGEDRQDMMEGGNRVGWRVDTGCAG